MTGYLNSIWRAKYFVLIFISLGEMIDIYIYIYMGIINRKDMPMFMCTKKWK